ncbi:hypothetical protein C0J52_23396 [Blattella germanica]|nr:hypothetical protein C0J52_23396 [Blattella germanica]
MAFTAGEKAFCVLEFHSRQSIIAVQRFFWREYGKDPPTVKTIHAWYRQFRNFLLVKKEINWMSFNITRRCGACATILYQRSPQKSTLRAS